MNADFLTFEQLKQLYPNEWILLGNPQMQNTTVLGGTVLYHSKDKKEVCYIGRDKTKDFLKVTIAFAGDLKQARKIGVLRRL
ncbi:hypothetical protein [Mucilaginibacter arboris]|uniref:Uncharacterized protein n=1 Tax=Mucilaginibacter arboris TaxID=2682090 RepID=A0A7K1SY83_9SPHI|nr:hypothetical protein [Mucilaginibacter arboris]MVN22263.1 hypothetical protein [Mucilaginibacter arboris]